MRAAYPVGILVSALVGIIVIAFFLKYLRRNNLIRSCRIASLLA